MSADPPHPLGRIAALLREAAVDYVLIGAHAVNVWLEPRLTADIDATVDSTLAGWARLEAVFADHGFALDARHGGTPASGPDFVRFVRAQDRTTLELQAAKTAYQRAMIARGIEHDGVRYATVEDLIILKLIADRPKDQEDLAGLIRIEQLDWPYVEHWAREWDVAPRLRRFKP